MQHTSARWDSPLGSPDFPSLTTLALHTFATSRTTLTVHDAFMPNLTRRCSCRSSSLTTHSGGRWELEEEVGLEGLPGCCKGTDKGQAWSTLV